MTTALPDLADLPAVGLDELVGSSALLTRVDRKYVLPRAAMAVVLDLAPDDTRVLEIGGARSFGYTTDYLDTPELLTFRLAAHRRRRRFKVRERRYDATGARYLEVKTRAGAATVKRRLEGGYVADGRLADEGARFVTDALVGSGVAPGDAVARLAPALTVRYDRTTLQLPGDDTRVTVDRALRWRCPDGAVLSRPDVVVVETKTPGAPSSLDRLLWSLGHRPRPMSKYATGLAALDPDLPGNRWTRTLREHLSGRGGR